VSKSQFALIISAISIILLLFFFGRNTPLKETTGANNIGAANSFDIDAYSEEIKQKLMLKPRDSLSLLQSLVSKRKPDSLNIIYLQQIAGIWENNSNFALASDFYRRVATVDSVATRWELAGDKLFEAYKISSDSLLRNYLLTNAVDAYTNVVLLDTSLIEPKIKLASLHVDELQNTMAGVTLLLGVVKKQPQHLAANLILGRLSLVSGQFDKAKKRLNTVLSVEPENTEALLFLAGVYEQTNETDKAIEYYKKCKALIKNPTIKQNIDKYLNKLINK